MGVRHPRLTKKLREPLWLVVMLHCYTASIEENQKNYNPIEHLLLHYIPDYISEKLI